MRIVLTVPSLAPEFGGPSAKGHGLGTALRGLGHEVTLVGAGREGENGAIALRPVARFHGTPVPLSLHRIPRLVRNADVVHVLGYRDPIGTFAAFASRRLQVPYLLEPAGMHRPQLRSLGLKAVFDATLGRLVVRGAELVVATSSSEATDLACGGISRDRVVIRPNGIDLGELERLPTPGGFRTRLALASSSPLVLSLGRLACKKGLPLLVEAIAHVPEAHLAIAGPDDRDGTLESVRDTISRLGLGTRVHLFPQGLWGPENMQALVDANLFCLFSMTENFGSAPAEAAACGVPVVVSDRCGLAEWLGDGVEIVPYGDVAVLAVAIGTLLSDPQRRIELAGRGRAAARALSWGIVAGQQAQLYERAVRPK